MTHKWHILAVAVVLATTSAGCGKKEAEKAAAEAEAAAAAAREAKIADALSAAYPGLASSSAVMDWDGTALKAGSGPYTCMPTPPQQAEAGLKMPMCMDAVWMEWAHAWENKQPFTARTVGVSYMLAGDGGASNIDPYATAETPDNDWVVEGPHLMVLVPNLAWLEGISTDPHNGGPYVMWKGTPYAHVMVPVKIPPKAASTDPVADALSAINADLAASATVMDWEMKTLKKGDGPYACMPTPPHQAKAGIASPMCMDNSWMSWADSWSKKRPTKVDRLGISYMLAGDGGASNVDPFADQQTADNQWIVEGPHMMLIVPDAAVLDSIPTDPQNGGPYVMWKGTPYAHVMVPVAD
jgi:hypothetical protein